MSQALSRWNLLPPQEAAKEILPCCGSRAWASGMASSRPLQDTAILLATSDRIWRDLPTADWLEAFYSHPRIGETRSPQESSARSQDWSAQEQSRAAECGDWLKLMLAEASREYEER